jgi:hypothetical protein
LGPLLERNADFDAGIVAVEEVVIFASYLDSSGPTYQPLGRARLSGG